MAYEAARKRPRTTTARHRLPAFLTLALDATEVEAARASAWRWSVPLLYGAVAAFGAANLAAGYLIFGSDGVHQPFRDLGPASFATSMITLACAGLGAVIARREAHGGYWRDVNNFWFLAAVGFLFLSIDAPLDIHGKIGLLIERQIGTPPAIDHWSDFVLVFYMAGGLALIACHWRELMRCPRALACLAAGALISAAMLAVDGGTAQRPWHQVAEESLELVAAATLLVAFLERFRFSLREASAAIGPRPDSLPR